MSELEKKYERLSQEELKMKIEESSDNLEKLRDLFKRFYQLEVAIEHHTQQLKKLKKLKSNAIREATILFADKTSHMNKQPKQDDTHPASETSVDTEPAPDQR